MLFWPISLLVPSLSMEYPTSYTAYRERSSEHLFQGESSPVLNVIWGVVNFLVGYALVFGVGEFQFGFNLGTLMLILGGIVISVALALILERIREH